MRRAQNKYEGSPVSDKGTLAVHVQEYRGGWTHISSLSSAYRSLHSPAESIRLSQLDCDVPSCDLWMSWIRRYVQEKSGTISVMNALRVRTCAPDREHMQPSLLLLSSKSSNILDNRQSTISWNSTKMCRFNCHTPCRFTTTDGKDYFTLHCALCVAGKLTIPPLARSSATRGEVNSSIMVSLTSAFSSLNPIRL